MRSTIGRGRKRNGGGGGGDDDAHGQQLFPILAIRGGMEANVGPSVAKERIRKKKMKLGVPVEMGVF